MRRYRFDMRGAQEVGETQHPVVVILKYAPLATAFEVFTIGDCWFFSAWPIDMGELPTFIKELP